MDRSTPIYLVSETYAQDSFGQHVATEVERKVYANVESITRAEWTAAGEMGIKPEYKLTMFAPDYAGEKIVRMETAGVMNTYGVYRTFRGRNEMLELYVEWKVGESNAENNSTGSDGASSEQHTG